MLVHTCSENWYAVMEDQNSPVRVEDDSLAQLERGKLEEFWKKPRYRFFSCPYRREKFVYKAIPLFLSSLALMISAMNNDGVKSILGIPPKDSKAMKLEEPVKVTIQADPLKIEQPIHVVQQTNSSAPAPSLLSNQNSSRDLRNEKKSKSTQSGSKRNRY